MQNKKSSLYISICIPYKENKSDDKIMPVKSHFNFLALFFTLCMLCAYSDSRRASQEGFVQAFSA